MGIAKGSSKQLRIKRQTAKGTMADGSVGGQILRRNTSSFNLQKEMQTTESEQTSKRQVMSARHGPRQVNGSINAILSPGTFSELFGALLMQDFVAVTAITGVSLTIAAAGAAWTLTRAAGDWLADKAKIGRVCRLSVGTLNASNIDKNLLIIGATANVLTVVPLNRRLTLVAEGPVANCTVSFPGKLSYTPDTGHVEPYFTVEEWFPDVPRSEVCQDCKVSQAQIRVPGSGNSTVDFTMLGLDKTKQAGVYFVSPTPETTTEALNASAGALFVNGTRKAVITDASLTIDGRAAVADAVVGDDIRPDVFSGALAVSGTMTGYFDTGTDSDLFIDETQTAIALALAGGTGAKADFVTLTMSNVKLTSADGDDNPTGIKRTYNFQAIYNAAGGTGKATNTATIEMQDSAVA